ncbi:hypothetical protein BDU57DRAFT_525038 [Ampelomyces quisqualis]|uniref:Uncharacterized protein n=1 Tax=Ampelomyces quisqualis TaxID=50730 RepID=A0A6A5Q5Z6_AMPQU|nr:hypothetical protein BDU57DRAFT_525038 [Ampelomyces quisqualis]
MAGTAPTKRRSTRSQTEAPGALHGTPQQRQSLGEISKPRPSKPLFDPAQLRQRVNDNGTMANQLLDLMKQAHAVLNKATENNKIHVQEAANAQSSLEAAVQFEMQLKQDISQELEWDRIPTAKDLRDAHTTKHKYVKSLKILQAMLPRLRAARSAVKD